MRAKAAAIRSKWVIIYPKVVGKYIVSTVIGFLRGRRPLFSGVSEGVCLITVGSNFLSGVPVILFSDLFLLLSALPTCMNVALPSRILSFFGGVCTCAVKLLNVVITNAATDSLTVSVGHHVPSNGSLGPASYVIYTVYNVLLLSIAGSIISVNKTSASIFRANCVKAGNFLTTFMTTFLAIGVCGIYVDRGIAVGLPGRIPNSVTRDFHSVFTFKFSVLTYTFVSLTDHGLLTIPFTGLMSTLVSPLFSTISACPNVTLVRNTITLFRFVNVRNTSIIVDPVGTTLCNGAIAGLRIFRTNKRPSVTLARSFADFVNNLNNSNYAFVIPVVLVVFVHSGRLGTVNGTSVVPIVFKIGRPIVFNVPVILGPCVFIPFLITPVIGTVVNGFFVSIVKVGTPVCAVP